MKKIVIAMLLILPLIIVATVLIATSIISNEAYIAVESVVLNVDTEQTIELGLSTQQFQLQATVFPTGAKNKNVVWSVENAQCFGDEIEHPATVSANGLLTMHTYSTFDVVVTTVEGSKRARANFYIKCDKLDSVTIFGSEDIKVGEKAILKAILNPLDAEVSNAVWASSDTNILAVDQNGIITAKKQGTASISVDIDGVLATKTITVAKNITKFGTEFWVGQTSFDINSLFEDGASGKVISVLSGGVIVDNTFTFNASEATLEVDGAEIIIKKCDTTDIEWENMELLLQKLTQAEHLPMLQVGKLPVYLSVVYKDVFADKAQPTFSSSDTKIATIDQNGKIVAQNKGKVTILATVGSKTLSAEFFAVRPVNFIRLNNINDDDKRGIAQNTVYGTKQYKDDNLVDFVFPLAIQYPNNADWSDYIMTTDNEHVKVVDNKIVVTKDFDTLTEVVVTVEAKYSAYESTQVRTRRKIILLGGVNCYSYSEILQATNASKAAMVQSNIVFDKNAQSIVLKNDFYGNGYLIDASNATKDKDLAILKIASDNVVVSNTQIRSDNIENINMANGLSGYALVVGEIEQSQRFENITIEYSIFENAYYGMDLHNADVYVNGCIIRNTSNFGIFLPSNLKNNGDCDYTNLTMNNCVMSNIVATAVGISTNSKPMEKQSNFYSTGFLDIYNWQDITSMRMLDRDLIPGDDATNTLLKKMISSTLKNEVVKKDYDHVRVQVDGINYVHLGIVTAGAIYPNTSIVEIEDERFVKLPIDILEKLRLEPCVLYLYEKDANIAPDTEYVESQQLYARLRGE